jgi:hypothetical protein
MDLDLGALLQALHEADVRFIVIGGVAVGAHGYIRATADLDVVSDPDPENLDRLVRVLDSLEATLPTAGDRRFDPGKDAKVGRRGGNVTADICSLTRLREMKQAQGRAQDRADLENLPEA